MTNAGKRLLDYLNDAAKKDIGVSSWRSGVLYAVECIENSLPAIEAEAFAAERARALPVIKAAWACVKGTEADDDFDDQSIVYLVPCEAFDALRSEIEKYEAGR